MDICILSIKTLVTGEMVKRSRVYYRKVLEQCKDKNIRKQFYYQNCKRLIYTRLFPNSPRGVRLASARLSGLVCLVYSDKRHKNAINRQSLKHKALINNIFNIFKEKTYKENCVDLDIFFY